MVNRENIRNALIAIIVDQHIENLPTTRSGDGKYLAYCPHLAGEIVHDMISFNIFDTTCHVYIANGNRFHASDVVQSIIGRMLSRLPGAGFLGKRIRDAERAELIVYIQESISLVHKLADRL